MRLLLGNDDGVFSLGIRALANTLVAAGHEVTVVCPDRERSATGHSLTIFDPIRAEPVEGLFDPRVQAWACSGTPSDCIKLGLGALLAQPPDFVVSGINQGANLGTDILYSGTVSAAMEGVMEGIPAIAMSLTSFTFKEFQPAANFARSLLAKIGQLNWAEPMLLNVNVPALTAADIAGVTITRQGIRRYHDLFQKRIDPRGKTYYWLAGEVLEDMEEPAASGLPATVLADVEAIRKNMITITPLKYNLTYTTGISPLTTWLDSAQLLESW
jgi:5'-nucleotidase